MDAVDVVRVVNASAALLALGVWALIWRRDHRALPADLQLGLMSTAAFLVAVAWGSVEQILADLPGGPRTGITSLATGWALVALSLTWKHGPPRLSR